MKMFSRLSLFSLLCFILVNINVGATLIRPLAKAQNLKSYEFEGTISSFSTEGIYNTDGSEEALIEGDSFKKLDTDIAFRYGYSKYLGVEGGLRYRQSNSISLGNEASVSGLESYYFSAKYSFKNKGRLIYAVKFEGRQPAYSNEIYDESSIIPTDELVLGDDGTELTFSGLISYVKSHGHIYDASIGFRKPGNNLSSELPYLIRSTWLGSTFSFYLGVEGIFSMNGDEYSDAPLLKYTEVRQATGSTGLFNSINRSYIAPQLGLFMSFSKWRLGLEFAKVIKGVSTDKGTRMGLNILWSSEGESRQHQKVKSFKEYNVEATVIKVSPRGKFIQIDKGLSSDIEKGTRFDIYQSDYFGGNILVAEAIAFEVAGVKSILKILRRAKGQKVEAGYTARAK